MRQHAPEVNRFFGVNPLVMPANCKAPPQDELFRYLYSAVLNMVEETGSYRLCWVSAPEDVPQVFGVYLIDPRMPELKSSLVVLSVYAGDVPEEGRGGFARAFTEKYGVLESGSTTWGRGPASMRLCPSADAAGDCVAVHFRWLWPHISGLVPAVADARRARLRALDDAANRRADKEGSSFVK